MQNKMGQMLTSLGLRVLEKSRGYYYPPSTSSMAADELSDDEYAVLLAEIDQFSAQFIGQPKKQAGLEESSPA